MSISSREDANKYYQVVNKLVDEYMDTCKIRPVNHKKYLKEDSDKFRKFIERNGLKDVNGIKQVIKDVLEDRVHMETDGVLTFESFKVFESDEFKITSLVQCLYKGVGKTDIKAEKFGDDGLKVFEVAKDWEDNEIKGMICIDEVYFTRDSEDDNIFVFKFIKAYN
jgi:hypothetical protein